MEHYTTDVVYTLLKLGGETVLGASQTMEGILKYITHLDKTKFRIDLYLDGLYVSSFSYRPDLDVWGNF